MSLHFFVCPSGKSTLHIPVHKRIFEVHSLVQPRWVKSPTSSLLHRLNLQPQKLLHVAGVLVALPLTAGLFLFPVLSANISSVVQWSQGSAAGNVLEAVVLSA